MTPPDESEEAVSKLTSLDSGKRLPVVPGLVRRATMPLWEMDGMALVRRPVESIRVVAACVDGSWERRRVAMERRDGVRRVRLVVVMLPL
jgi:hypothetical protein